ncbi:hypothetical protein CONCODRAFT_20741 [Conidiobolus coronatus NRRL 28638]|uniref:rRNA-processing protein FYV7 n=1 Tax=Conidiobolus coronatus (strain ATCC 28846 / CBS 209.66 / NRRL 28638) TaxID=796925 RepID=A0A137NRN2_CONC2|nr:hypothetical protein CONCODRAFT_20741 [Conidiobolus coronatus NRRL 28638]|eukprot:KXN65401.1 hypothetical protein CONCODRAFT_20741 [Conidiobolus coronatus NRRL 28638]
MRNNANSAKKSNYDHKTRTYTGKINKIRERKNYSAKIKTNFHKELNKKADPSMENLPDFYKEIFEEVDKEKEQDGKAESKPRNNYNSSKPNPFKRTMQKRDQIQAEIRAKKEEKEREFKERADLKEKNEKLRKKQKSKLNQRGKKGQLILSNHIDHLLTKIQK